MTTPQPTEPDDENGEAPDEDDCHPTRASDVAALISKEVA